MYNINMIYSYKYRKVTWVDLENPTTDEVRKISEQYNIDPVVANELLSPSLRSKADCSSNYIYLILHFPSIVSTNKNQFGSATSVEEIDFIIGHDFIITTRYSAMDALLEFSKVFEVQSILDRKDMGEHAGYVFFFMIQYLYKSIIYN